MIIGHLPFLSNLASVLLTGKKKHSPISFKYSGVVCVEKSSEGKWSARKRCLQLRQSTSLS